MANLSSANLTSITNENVSDDPNSTVTFLIGFGVLMLFLLLGVAASAFLCTTLKKDPYLLWPTEVNAQFEEKLEDKEKTEEEDGKTEEENCNGRRKSSSDEVACEESTQI